MEQHLHLVKDFHCLGVIDNSPIAEITGRNQIVILIWGAILGNMKNNIFLAFIAAVVYALTYMVIQGYYNRPVTPGEIILGGVVFFLAFAGAHALVNRFKK